MYITNKEIINTWFNNNNKIDHIIISDNEFGTNCIAFDNKHNVIEIKNKISIEIDNEYFVITEYDEDNEVSILCTIPLDWLMKNSECSVN